MHMTNEQILHSWELICISNTNQNGRRCAHLTACLCDEHVVLNAHTNACIWPKLWVVGDVQAWLNGQHHARLQGAEGSNGVGVMYI